MHEVIADVTIQSGRVSYPPGSVVPVKEFAEALRLVRGKHAHWPPSAAESAETSVDSEPAAAVEQPASDATDGEDTVEGDDGEKDGEPTGEPENANVDQVEDAAGGGDADDGTADADVGEEAELEEGVEIDGTVGAVDVDALELPPDEPSHAREEARPRRGARKRNRRR